VGVLFLRKTKFQMKKNHIAPHWSMRNSNQLRVWEQYAGLTVLQHVILQVQDYGLGGKSAQIIVNSWSMWPSTHQWARLNHHHGPPLVPTIGTFFTFLSNAS
jgi:hypothetical protein